MAEPLRVGGGGILGLAGLIRDHADAVEADLLTHYRVDLLDLFRPGTRLTIRRCLLLIRHMPAESYTRHVLADAVKKAEEQAKVDRIRSRQEFYRNREG